MIADPRPARPRGGGPRPSPRATWVGVVASRRGGQHGSLTLEAVLMLPLLALLVAGLLGAVGIVRDVLVLHEAARAGARTAATSSGTASVVRAAQQAAPELPDLRVTVTPTVRRDGDLVRVRVEVVRHLGPISHRLRAATVARVEPAVGTAHGPGAHARTGSGERNAADRDP